MEVEKTNEMKIVKFAFSLFGINTYIVYDPSSRKAAVIDPGMIDSDEEEALAAFVKREGLTVTHIINTHLHIDHAIGDKYAKKIFGAPVYAHRADEPLGARMTQQAQMFGLAARIDSVSVNSYLEDGDVIRIGSGELEVIHVPGHSPGGIALYDAKDGFVIAGDSLFAGSIGRTDLPGGDMKTLLNAVKGRLLTLPPETVVYSGHGPETTIGREAAVNPFLRQ